MNGPSRFETTPEQIARNACGLAACRRAIAGAVARLDQPAEEELTPSDVIRLRALERATAERRERRIHGLEPIGDLLPTRPA